MDFNDLCELDPEEKMTVKEMIDKLRALTHGAYKNAYFIDENNNKIYIRVSLEKADSDNDDMQ